MRLKEAVAAQSMGPPDGMDTLNAPCPQGHRSESGGGFWLCFPYSVGSVVAARRPMLRDRALARDLLGGSFPDH